MKILLTTLVAAFLALSVGGAAQAGDRHDKHQDHSSRDRRDNEDQQPASHPTRYPTP